MKGKRKAKPVTSGWHLGSDKSWRLRAPGGEFRAYRTGARWALQWWFKSGGKAWPGGSERSGALAAGATGLGLFRTKAEAQTATGAWIVAEANPHALSAGERRRLPSSDFALPKARKFPIEDQDHALRALSYVRAGRGKAADFPKVVAAISKRYASDPVVMDAVKRTKALGYGKRKRNPPARAIRQIRTPDGKADLPVRWYSVPGVDALRVHHVVMSGPGKAVKTGAGWQITHRLSGARLGTKAYKTKKAAIAAAKRATSKVAGVPWRWFDWGVVDPESRDKVQRWVKAAEGGR